MESEALELLNYYNHLRAITSTICVTSVNRRKSSHSLWAVCGQAACYRKSSGKANISSSGKKDQSCNIYLLVKH